MQAQARKPAPPIPAGRRGNETHCRICRTLAARTDQPTVSPLGTLYALLYERAGQAARQLHFAAARERNPRTRIPADAQAAVFWRVRLAELLACAEQYDGAWLRHVLSGAHR